MVPLCFFACSLFSQIKISVISSTTRQSISYVQLSDLTGENVYYTDSSGRTLVQFSYGDTVSVFAWGYEPYRWIVTNSNKDVLVALKPRVITLEEVLVVDKKSHSSLNWVSLFGETRAPPLTFYWPIGTTLVSSLQFKGKHSVGLAKFAIQIAGPKPSQKATMAERVMLRAVVFSASMNGVPDSLLYASNPMVVKPTSGWIEFLVADGGVYVPSDGVFVGIEIIGTSALQTEGKRAVLGLRLYEGNDQLRVYVKRGASEWANFFTSYGALGPLFGKVPAVKVGLVW